MIVYIGKSQRIDKETSGLHRAIVARLLHTRLIYKNQLLYYIPTMTYMSLHEARTSRMEGRNTPSILAAETSPFHSQ